MDSKVIKIISDYQQENKTIAMVTIVTREGCSPRKVGKSMAVDEHGQCLAGSIGGGLIESLACDDAVEALRNGAGIDKTYDLALDNELHGMKFNGRITVFIQVYKSKDKLIIVGGSKIGEQLAYYAKPLDYEIHIIDHREGMLVGKYPDAYTYEGNVEEILSQMAYDDKTSIVIVTHAHIFDHEAIRMTLDKPCRYIGMIGSGTKIKKCFDRLVAEKINLENWSKVSTPVGLDIGGSTPSEIALSIISEIQMVKYKKTGKLYKEIKSA